MKYSLLAVFCGCVAGLSQAQTLVFAPTTLNFVRMADSGVGPAGQTIQITSATGSNLDFAFYGTVGQSGKVFDYFNVTPSRGTTPATVTINVNINAAAEISGPSVSAFNLEFMTGTPAAAVYNVAQVTLTTTAPPPPVLNQVLNAATLQSGAISPAEIMTLKGLNLGPLYDLTRIRQELPSSPYYDYPTISGGTTVTFDGVAAPILYAALEQINLVAPSTISGSTVIVVTHDGQSTPPIRVPVVDTSPGVFTLAQNGSGPGAILNSDNTPNSAANPAPRSSIIQMFSEGAGLFNGLSGRFDGVILHERPPYPIPLAKVSLTIGGKDAVITYAGIAPNLLFGVLQVDAVIPSDLTPGPQPLVLTVGSNINNQRVTVAVQ